MHYTDSACKNCTIRRCQKSTWVLGSQWLISDPSPFATLTNFGLIIDFFHLVILDFTLTNGGKRTVTFLSEQPTAHKATVLHIKCAYRSVLWIICVISCLSSDIATCRYISICYLPFMIATPSCFSRWPESNRKQFVLSRLHHYCLPVKFYNRPLICYPSTD